MKIILTVLVAHYVADFLCQIKWMRENKHELGPALVLHVLVYSTVLGLLAGFIVEPTWVGLRAFIFVNGIAHYFIDGVTSNITHWLYGKKRIRALFDVVGLDQLLHTMLLVFTSRMLES